MTEQKKDNGSENHRKLEELVLEFNYVDSRIVDSLLKESIPQGITLSTGQMKIEERRFPEQEGTFHLIVVDHRGLNHSRSQRILFPASSESLVQFAREILRQFAPTTEDLILKELRRLKKS